jgi:hypothetical protein
LREDDSSSDTRKVGPDGAYLINSSPTKEETEHEDRSQDRRFKQNQAKTNDRLVLLNFLLFVGTLATAIVGVFQTAASFKAVKESQEALALARQSSLDSSKQFQTQLEHFDASLGVSQAQVFQTGQLALHAGEQAGSSASMAETTKTELEISQRPWVIVRAAIASDLTYGANGATITLHYTLFNAGHTPALKTIIWPKFYLPFGKKISTIEERERFCSDMSHMSAGDGQTIYPNQVFEQNQTINLPVSDIDEYLKKTETINPNKLMVVSVIDCVTYQSNFTKTVYTVADSYGLARPYPQGNGVGLMLEAYKNTGSTSLVLIPEGFSPSDTK